MQGLSRSIVELIEIDGYFYVRKSGNVKRNIEQIHTLKSAGIRVPNVISESEDCFVMEYIPHQDIRNFLSVGNIHKFGHFLSDIFKVMSRDTVMKDYSHIYQNKLDLFPWTEFSLPFSKKALYESLPKIIPKSLYHGDLTFDNILITHNESFFLIDPLVTDYDSYVFDLAKLKQDLICKWFLRNEKGRLDSKLMSLNQYLQPFSTYSSNSLNILMLMRVLPYTNTSDDKSFLESEIERLWKS